MAPGADAPSARYRTIAVQYFALQREKPDLACLNCLELRFGTPFAFA